MWYDRDLLKSVLNLVGFTYADYEYKDKKATDQFKVLKTACLK